MTRESLYHVLKKQQVSPFPDRNQFCFNRGENFSPGFKFQEPLNTLKRAFIFWGVCERYYRLAGESREAVGKL